MPVNLEQPSPMAPRISQKAGQAEVALRALPALAQAYAAAVGAQSRIISSQNETALGDRQLASREAMQGRELDTETMLARERMQHAYGMQQQRAELQNWVNEQELSHGEKVRLQRNQNAIGEIQAAVRRGEIDEETGNALLLQVRADQQVLQWRAQRDSARSAESLAKLREDQLARQTKAMTDMTNFANRRYDEEINGSKEMKALGDKFAAGGFGGGIGALAQFKAEQEKLIQDRRTRGGPFLMTDPSTNKQAYFQAVPNQHGFFQLERVDFGKDAAAEKPFDEGKAESDALKRAKVAVEGKHGLRAADEGYAAKLKEEYDKALDETAMKQVIEMRKKNPRPGNELAPRGGPEPLPQPRGQDHKALQWEWEAKPFKLDDPKSQSSEQRQQVGLWDSFAKDVDEGFLTPGEQKELKAFIEEAKSTLAGKGSQAQIMRSDPEAAKRYQQILDHVHFKIKEAQSQERKLRGSHEDRFVTGQEKLSWDEYRRKAIENKGR